MPEVVCHPTPAAERMRLHRERRRQGWRYFMIALHVTEIDALVAMGLLKSECGMIPRRLAKYLVRILTAHWVQDLDAKGHPILVPAPLAASAFPA